MTRKDRALCALLFFFFGSEVLPFKLIHSIMSFEELPLEAGLYLSVETEFLSMVRSNVCTCDSWGFLDETGIFTSSVEKWCQAELGFLHLGCKYHKYIYG